MSFWTREGSESARFFSLGEVREAHVWFDGGNGPLQRPSDTPPVPATLDWDLWLGPAARRPYHSAYLPASWRGWRAFGSGIVGDFGCHTANLMFRALRLEQLWTEAAGRTPNPQVLRVEAKPSEVDDEGYPRSLRAMIELPARGPLPPVKLTLYAQERPSADLILGFPMAGWGDLLVGPKASLYSECPWNTRGTQITELAGQAALPLACRLIFDDGFERSSTLNWSFTAP